MVQSIFEEMGGRYERQGEYILPCLTIPPEKEQSIDLFGRRHLDYLREYRKITYTNLLTSGRLNAYLSSVYSAPSRFFLCLYFFRYPLSYWIPEDFPHLDVFLPSTFPHD